MEKFVISFGCHAFYEAPENLFHAKVFIKHLFTMQRLLSSETIMHATLTY
jgi:hypothetical protein